MKKIKLLLFVLLLFIFIPNVKAEVKTFERNNTNNFGVNKKWKITNKNKQNVLKTPLVDATEKIYDFSNVLTSEEIKTLKEKINYFIGKYKTELIIVTYNLPYTNDSENDTFASDFYDYNDFGLDFKKYDGIVLFRNTYSDNPYYDIYTFGEAQLYFTHENYDSILDGIYTDLHEGKYLEGFSYFISMVEGNYISGIPNELKNYIVDDNGFLKKLFVPSYFVISIISFIIAISVTLHYKKKNKMIILATKASEYLDQKNINYSVKEDKFVKKHLTSYVVSSSSGSGGGGYHSSGGSSGGGFSSGGGRHG